MNDTPRIRLLIPHGGALNVTPLKDKNRICALCIDEITASNSMDLEYGNEIFTLAACEKHHNLTDMTHAHPLYHPQSVIYNTINKSHYTLMKFILDNSENVRTTPIVEVSRYVGIKPNSPLGMALDIVTNALKDNCIDRPHVHMHEEVIKEIPHVKESQ